jgi:hypothetical protein
MIPHVVEASERYDGKQVPNFNDNQTSTGVSGTQCGGKFGGV